MTFKVVRIVDMPWMLREKPSIITDAGGEFTSKHCRTAEEIIEFAHDADFIITIARLGSITRDIMGKLEKCRFINTVGRGYDGIDVEAATDYGIGVLCNPDYGVEELSDHLMGLILACSRRIVQLDHIIKDGKLSVLTAQSMPFIMAQGQVIGEIWSQMECLRGKTLGFIGFGQIARATVPKARAFGLNILAFDPYVSKSVADEMGVSMVDINQVLKESDFVSINAPLTPETVHLLGREQLKKMKSTAYLINTARGRIVDEPALCEALTQGYIAGAGLDVTDPEPPVLQSPLLKLDNVILTGHSAFASPASLTEVATRPLENAAKVMRGEWPPGMVNPEVKQRVNVRGPVLENNERS
jgi:D-3-phosphoglycerate dehydrogenase